jgi:formylglycine-generating enzyme required for sulfatase activity
MIYLAGKLDLAGKLVAKLDAASCLELPDRHMKKILILASNPRKDLNLDREIRDLQGVIERSRNRAELEVEVGLAVRVGDLQDRLFQHQPNIVHFCGHGGGAEGLVLEGEEDGGERWVKAEALAGLFRLFPDVSCVLLNACYSEEQANAIVCHIDYVIGMRQTIRDDAAIAFSKGFYRALGYDCSIEQSFEFGCNAIQLEISGSSKVLRSVAEPQRKLEVLNAIESTAIPEDQKPILKRKATLGDSAGAISAETRVAIQFEVGEALEEEDSSLREYREQVQEYLADRKLEDHEKFFLDQLRDELGLSVEETEAIIQQELAPIQEAQSAYAKRLSALIAAGYDPKDRRNQAEMKKFQARKNLTDEEVETVSQPILAAEAARQEVLRQKQIKQQETAEQEQQRQTEAAQQAEADRLRREAEERQRREQAEQAEADRLRREAEQPVLTPIQSFYSPSPSVSSSALPTPAAYWSRRRVIQTAGLAALGVAGTSIAVTGGRLLQQQTKRFTEELGNGITLETVQIPGGEFLMGSPDSEKGREPNESPQHLVTVQPFKMGRFEVTQAQWEAIASLPKGKIDLNPAPSYFKDRDRPVETVSWDDAVEFCERLSGKTGKKYRLPSEAEWEYACRAGKTTPFNFGETLSPDQGNYKSKGSKETIAVGKFPHNAFGLYDMHGNVWEWCADYWHGNYRDAPTDGSPWIEGVDNKRLMRGGSWDYSPDDCRSARRGANLPTFKLQNLGFRVVCDSAWT